MKRILVALGLTLLTAQALANSTTWTVQFTVQVRDACEFLSIDPQHVDVRCTMGILAPSTPGLLPDAPVAVQAFDLLRLSGQEAYQGPGGGVLLHYRVQPSAADGAEEESATWVTYY